MKDTETIQQRRAHPDHCFSTRELASRWRLSERTLQRWRKNGTGPSWLKLEGRVLYRLADVLAFEVAGLRTGEAGR